MGPASLPPFATGRSISTWCRPIVAADVEAEIWRSSIFISLAIFLTFPYAGVSNAPWVSRQKLYSVPRMDIFIIKS